MASKPAGVLGRALGWRRHLLVLHVVQRTVPEEGDHFFFFQAEDGIRDLTVTGVQTCALPILRYPASACGLFALKPTRARNPLGPEYGDVAAGGAVEHALTRSVRDSAALLDATSGPAVGDPYWAPPPTRPFLSEVGVDPGRLRIGFTTRTPDGDLGHPDCAAAAEQSAELCAKLGHEVVETDWPGFTPEIGEVIATMIGAATSWIVRYWIRHVGREPASDEIEPLTRVLWEAGDK